MKNLCKTLLLSLILTINAEAQSVTWQNWYDYQTMDSEARIGVQCFDGGYMILTNNYAFNNNSILLIKLDYLGNIEWQKLIDNSLIGFGLSCFSLSQALDSGFVISGFGSKAVLHKTDSKGEILWVRQYIRPGYSLSRFYDHQITSDNGIMQQETFILLLNFTLLKLTIKE